MPVTRTTLPPRPVPARVRTLPTRPFPVTGVPAQTSRPTHASTDSGRGHERGAPAPVQGISGGNGITAARRPNTVSQPRRFRATEEDRLWLAFLTRHRYATVPVLAERFEVSHGAVRWRLRRLVAAHPRPLIAASAKAAPGGLTLYQPTTAGRLASRTGLRTPNKSRLTHLEPTQVHHTLMVARLAGRLERQGWEVVSEREIRQADTIPPGHRRTAAPMYAATKPMGGVHYPDMMIRRPGDGAWTALELERSRKSDERLNEILVAYRDATHVSRVVYVCMTLGVALQVARAGERAGLSSKGTGLRCQPWPKAELPL